MTRRGALTKPHANAYSWRHPIYMKTFRENERTASQINVMVAGVLVDSRTPSMRHKYASDGERRINKLPLLGLTCAICMICVICKHTSTSLAAKRALVLRTKSKKKRRISYHFFQPPRNRAFFDRIEQPRAACNQTWMRGVRSLGFGINCTRKRQVLPDKSGYSELFHSLQAQGEANNCNVDTKCTDNIAVNCRKNRKTAD